MGPHACQEYPVVDLRDLDRFVRRVLAPRELPPRTAAIAAATQDRPAAVPRRNSVSTDHLQLRPRWIPQQVAVVEGHALVRPQDRLRRCQVVSYDPSVELVQCGRVGSIAL